ncbi:UPF0348 protein YlbM [Desulfuromonas versatilis]|uniref:tRNA(Met) cytidine acetate ligase n=1 Tax=Desulfuromonas versatilis TaxID=2802975 RepID=A0ABM8HQ71_9BACT|nr:nucleotidyltransferase [Desulfuromonas versatilis]BCR03891.1 UPF0348 protein YlbM [Desulfuromonas versatilis]
MRAVGLITEYNPFHNGHLHHLQRSKSVADAEVAVAVMSGHFLQRGEPALVDKWVRTEMALAAGVDLVLELPFPFACNSAPYFAQGAVQALDALGGVESVCFGSESGELGTLEGCAQLLLDQEETLAGRTGELLRTGVGYPEARARASGELSPSPAIGDLLATPNNILGIEYLKALRATGSAIRPLTIPRIGAGYHDVEAVGEIASATGIRRMVDAGTPVEAFIPSTCRAPLLQALAEGRCLDTESLHRLLLARLFRGAESLRGLYQLEEGIETRLVEAAESSTGYDGLVGSARPRQFTRTRIQRLLAYLLNEVSAAQMADFLACGPLYLHLLGSSAKGREFLSANRKQFALPLVQNYSRVRAILKRHYGSRSQAFRVAEAMLELELRATRNYTLLMRRWPGGHRNRDFFEPVRFG